MSRRRPGHGRQGLGHLEGEGREIGRSAGCTVSASSSATWSSCSTRRLMRATSSRSDAATARSPSVSGWPRGCWRRARAVCGNGGEVALRAEALVEAIEGGIDRPHQRCQLPRQAVERQASLAHRRGDPGRRSGKTLQGPETVAQGQEQYVCLVLH